MVIRLAGLPGSGKTTYAQMLEKEGFTHVRIDKFYEETPRVDETVEWFLDKEYIDAVYKAFEDEILKQVSEDQNIVIENIGLTGRLDPIIEHIKTKTEVIEILLIIDPELAKRRVLERNKTDYKIKVDEKNMDYYISKLDELNNNFDIKIRADRLEKDVIKEILTVIKNISN